MNYRLGTLLFVTFALGAMNEAAVLEQLLIRKAGTEDISISFLPQAIEVGLNLDCIGVSPDIEGMTPLMCAAASGNAVNVTALLRNGASIDQQKKTSSRNPTKGFTALMFGVLYGNITVCELLLEHNADVTLQEYYYPMQGLEDFDAVEFRRTALNIAVEQGYLEICRLLLAHGGKKVLNQRDSVGGFTPVMRALYEKNWELSSLLLANGARISALERIAPRGGARPIRNAFNALCAVAQQGQGDLCRDIIERTHFLPKVTNIEQKRARIFTYLLCLQRVAPQLDSHLTCLLLTATLEIAAEVSDILIRSMESKGSVPQGLVAVTAKHLTNKIIEELQPVFREAHGRAHDRVKDLVDHSQALTRYFPAINQKSLALVRLYAQPAETVRPARKLSRCPVTHVVVIVAHLAFVVSLLAKISLTE